MTYARESLTLEDVIITLKSKEIDERLGQEIVNSDEGLSIRGRFDKRDGKQKDRNRSKSQRKKKSAITIKSLAIIRKNALKERKIKKISKKLMNMVMSL